MTKILVSLFLLGFTAGMMSCQKEITPLDPSELPGGTPGDTTVKSEDYLPLTAGTYWKYKDSTTQVISTVTLTADTVNIDNRRFTVAINTSPTSTDSSYYTKEGADYYMLTKGASPTDSGQFLFHFLNDTAAAGSSWEYLAGQANGFDAYVKTTIVEKEISLVVNNKTFTNVIHTQLDLTYDIFGTLTPAGSYHYYMAKGIGIIRVRADLGFLGTTYSTVSDLIEYQIK